MRLTKIILAFALVFTLCGCQQNTPGQEDSGLINTLTLPQDFILGMDASCVPALEKSGVTYYNSMGQVQDVFQTLAQHGINHIRVRIWNNPYDDEGNGFGGGNCDMQNALQIGKRATQFGMKLMPDFHYSDFWADPGKQAAPRQWANMPVEEKAQALYQYTKQSLQLLKDNHVSVGAVQVGNETNGAMCGETSWESICLLMSAGSKAVREVFPEAKVVLHFANPEKTGTYALYAQKLAQYQVDYDIFASSYYPYWHGTLENLSAVLTKINATYQKQVMVAETSYAYTEEDTDFHPNTIHASSHLPLPYPINEQGQSDFVRSVIETVGKIPGGIGVCYWEGTWISVGQNSWEENRTKWETFGSGWASSYAGVYDSRDAGQYFGGCAVENQALFDPQGHPLSALKIFRIFAS